ncbi:MAG: thiamine phosphate synthase [Acidobacteriaceae bacterium]
MFPRLYAIADVDMLAARSLPLEEFTADLLAAGVQLVQYRNKNGSARDILQDAAQIRKLFAGASAKFILNDRADLALLAHCDGVHVGQDDLAAEDARSIVGPDTWVGVSTHTPEQVLAADKSSCDYIAYGPVFPTATKNNPDPTVGLDGLRFARACTGKPLVAIGGISRANCRAVLEAGADSVAIVSDMLPSTGSRLSATKTTQRIAQVFLALLGST